MKNTKILSVIDIGSNSIKLLVLKTQGAQILQEMHRNSAVTKLGSRLLKDKSISKEVINECFSVIASFHEEASEYKTDDIVAFGTHALRNAPNRKFFSNRFTREFLSSLSILSPEEEIMLSHKGVLSESCFQQKHIAHIDIGGGSTEIIFSDAGSIVEAESLPIGCVSLSSAFKRADTISETELSIVTDIVLQKIEHFSRPFDQVTSIGTGGSILQLASLIYAKEALEHSDIHHARLSLKTLRDAVVYLAHTPLNIRKQIARLDPQRAETIIPGILILIAFMEKFEIPEIIISTHGIRYGAALAFLENQEKLI